MVELKTGIHVSAKERVDGASMLGIPTKLTGITTVTSVRLGYFL